MVKQNDVKIPILFYKSSVSNFVIYFFILEVCFCNVLYCSGGLTPQCQGKTIIVKVKISLIWAGTEEGMDPRNWGWNLQDNRLVPLMSTMNAAPDNLLKIIHSNCSTSCKTLRCSCRK